MLRNRPARGGRFCREPKNRYMMRQKLAAFGNDFCIENERGKRVFKVDGKILHVRETLNFRNLNGTLLCQIQERTLRVRDVMAIEAPGRGKESPDRPTTRPFRGHGQGCAGHGRARQHTGS